MGKHFSFFHNKKLVSVHNKWAYKRKRFLLFTLRYVHKKKKKKKKKKLEEREREISPSDLRFSSSLTDDGCAALVVKSEAKRAHCCQRSRLAAALAPVGIVIFNMLVPLFLSILILFYSHSGLLLLLTLLLTLYR